MDELEHLFGNSNQKKNQSQHQSDRQQFNNNVNQQRKQLTNKNLRSDAAFLSLLREKYPNGVSGEDLMALLSSFVQSRQRELRSGVSNLSLNTPCLSYLSMCLSHQRDENSEKVALPNASRMDQQRRSILKLSIMLRELAHLCLLEPKASRKKNKATKQQQQQQQQQQQIEQENRKEEEFLYCDISIFPTLRVLEARGVHPKQLIHLDSLRSTLEVLSIENANITSPSQVLSSSGGTDNFTPWSNLTNVRLSKCGMVVLDASVSLLSAAVVIQFNDNSLHDVSIGLSVLPRLQRLQHLDLSFNRISSLVGFSHSALEPQEYCKMQTLVLRHNKLTSTEGLGVLVSLRQLDLGHNMISAMDPEIVRLRKLPQLNALTLEGNPIALLDNYRSHTCAAVARAQRKHAHGIVLDGHELKLNEISKARSLLHLYSEMEHTCNNGSISPIGSALRYISSSRRRIIKDNRGNDGISFPSMAAPSPESTASYLRSIGSDLLLGKRGGSGGNYSDGQLGRDHRAVPPSSLYMGEYPGHSNVDDIYTNNGGVSDGKINKKKKKKKKSKHRRRRTTRIVQFEEDDNKGNYSPNRKGLKYHPSSNSFLSDSGRISMLSDSCEGGMEENDGEECSSTTTITSSTITSCSKVRNNEEGETKSKTVNDGGKREDWDSFNQDGEREADHWEDIRLYKEKLAKKMAAYQESLEKKRSRHGSNWLDERSPDQYHRKNYSMIGKNGSVIDVDRISDSGNDINQNDSLRSSLKNNESNSCKVNVPTKSKELITDINNFGDNRSINSDTKDAGKVEQQEEDMVEDIDVIDEDSESNYMEYDELDKQLQSIEYIAEVFDRSLVDDEDDQAIPIVLRICGNELSEIDMTDGATGRTIKKRSLSQLLSVHTARGTFGDTVLRVEFQVASRNSLTSNNNGEDDDNYNNDGNCNYNLTSEHVLYVLRQAGTLGQLLGVLNARIALNEYNRNGEEKELKLQCLSCLLVFLWKTSASKEQKHLACPKCYLPNLRISEKNLSKSVRHDMRTALKESNALQAAALDAQINDSDNGNSVDEDTEIDGKDGSVLPSINGSCYPLTGDWEYKQQQNENEKDKNQQIKDEPPLSTSRNRIMDNFRKNISQAFSFGSGGDKAYSSGGSDNLSGDSKMVGIDYDNNGTLSAGSNNDDVKNMKNDGGDVGGNGVASCSNQQRTISTTTDGLLIDEHLEKYFREVTFAAGINDNTERFHAIFSTNIAPHATHASIIKNGTGKTERGAYVVTTDESVYFISRLPIGNGLKFSDRPEFSTIARYSLSDVCRINIGFSGQRLRIDFVDASWVLITRNKRATYHFVQKVMPMIKTKRTASRRRGTLKIPRNPLAVQAIREGAMDSSSYGVDYTNEDQITLENIHEYVIGQGNAGRSKDQAISTRVKLCLMLYERPNPSSVRLIRHVPKNCLVPRTLIITESALYLCDEDYALEWPKGTPPFKVLRSALLNDCIEMVLKDDQRDITLVIVTPVVGFVKTNKRWRLRCINRDVKDQLVNLLKVNTNATVV